MSTMSGSYRWLFRAREHTAGTVRSVEADDLRAQDSGANEAQASGDRLIANRLDAMEAERVLQRALELEAESLDQPHVITTEQLERIAKEIGVDTAFVHQALGEVRLEPATRSWFARGVLPAPLFETATISGLSRDDVDASIHKWMTQNEGMTAAGMLADGVEWDVDRRWRARMLSRSISGGNRISRVASGDLTHRVHSVNEQEHIIAFESQGRLPLLFARLALGAGSTLGFLAALGASVSDDLATGLIVSAVLVGVSALLGIGGARWWARGIRGALRQSLVGLVGSATAKRRRWFGRRRKGDA